MTEEDRYILKASGIWVWLLEELQESVYTLYVHRLACVCTCVVVCECVMWKGVTWGRCIELDSILHLTLAWRWACAWRLIARRPRPSDGISTVPS